MDNLRDILIKELLEDLNKAVPEKGHVHRNVVLALHDFYESQYDALLKRERETCGRREMKTPVEIMLDGLPWRAVEPDVEPSIDSGLPTVTHEGVLKIGGFSLRCYQLSDGTRVFDADDITAFFGGDIRFETKG